MKEGRSVEEKMRMREENRDEAVEAAAAERMITVSFNADVSDGMPWRFVPAQRSVKVSKRRSMNALTQVFLDTSLYTFRQREIIRRCLLLVGTPWAEHPGLLYRTQSE